MDWEERLRNQEDSLTERKRACPKDAEIRKAVVGFANSARPDRAGLLVIGVSDDGIPRGVEGTDSIQKTLRKNCEDCYPPVTFRSEVRAIDGKDVVAVEVPLSANRPHFAGKAFVRVGSETIEASRDQLNQLIDSRFDVIEEITQWPKEIITLFAIDKEPGRVQRSAGRSSSRHDVMIEEITPFYLRLRLIATGTFCSEDVRGVWPLWDDQRQRHALVVRPVEDQPAPPRPRRA